VSQFWSAVYSDSFSENPSGMSRSVLHGCTGVQDKAFCSLVHVFEACELAALKDKKAFVHSVHYRAQMVPKGG
jgi:hypothetical protein